MMLIKGWKKKDTISIYIILLILIAGFRGLSQPICTMKQYSYSDGYTHGRVFEILQDRKGLIWFCTRDGLSNFDGYTFKNIKTYPGEGVAMGSSNIGSIYENSQGDIWCRNQDGRVYLFDVKENKFYDVMSFIDPATQFDAVLQVVPLRKGVSWAICKDGTCIRFDDKECKNGKGVETYHFGGKVIQRIFEDSEGDEWIFGEQKVTVLGKKKFTSDRPFIYTLEKEKNLWLSDGKELLIKYSFESGKTDTIPYPVKVRYVACFRMLNQDTLAIGTTHEGLLLYSLSEKRFNQIGVNVEPGAKNEVFSVFEDSEGDFWMSNRKPGVIHYRKSDGLVTILQSPKNERLKHEAPNRFMVMEDKQNIVWVIPQEGNLCYFDRAAQQLNYYYTNQEDPFSIISPQIRSYYIDRQGNVWFENDRSLGKLSMFSSEFRLIPKESDEFEIRAILNDREGNIWVGAKNKKLRVLGPDFQSAGYVSAQGTLEAGPLPFDGNVYSLLEDHNGDIWVGTRLDGLYRLQPVKGQSKTYRTRHFISEESDPYSLSNNNIYSIFEDHAHRIWIGTYGGGINLVEEGKREEIRFIHHGNRLGQYPKHTASQVRFISEVDQQTMLLATTNGLISFSSRFQQPEEIKFYVNKRRPEDPASLNNSDVFYTLYDRNKNLFVLTRNGGISRLISPNLLNDSLLFDSFTERDGLISDFTLAMVEDRNGKLWLISNQGFSNYHPDLNRVDHLNSFIFRNNIQFSEAPPVLSRSGKILMGTDKGILEFDPGKSIINNYVPTIIFTDFLVQGVRLAQPAHVVEKLALKPSQRNLSIQFAALDYRDSKEIQYAYKMEGIDKEWHYVGKERMASYINLPHGHYRFMVKSTNSEGIWTENTRTLPIRVNPKFQETIYAWILIIILIIVLIQIGVYISFSFYKLRHAIKVEQKISDQKLNFFT